MKKIYIKCLMGIFIITFFLLSFFSSLIAHNWENPFLRSNEFLLDSNIVYIPASGSSPSIAYDGTNYFVVWVDNSIESDYNIYGSRVNQSGELIDSTGIMISNAPDNQVNPSLAYNGINYLVVWSDLRNGSYDIYGTRVSTSGIVLDTADIFISSSTSYDLMTPAVTSGGKYFFVVWKEQLSPTTGYIRGTRVDTSGIVIDTLSIVINSTPIAYISPDVSFDGQNFFTVWTIATHTYGARIDTSGTVIDTTNILIATNPGLKMNPNIAFDGIRYAVIWQDNRNSSYDIYGVRVDTSGVVIDSSAIGIVCMNSDLKYPKIVFIGEIYLLTWEDYRTGYPDIYGARVDTSVVLLDSIGIPISTHFNEEFHPSVAFDGLNFLIVWSEADSGIYGARLDTTGLLIDSTGINVSSTVCPQWHPSCSFDGRNYFVVWQDERTATDYNIYGVRVDTTSAIIDPIPIPISTEVVNQQFCKVAFSPVNYFVVWQDDRFSNIYGTRIDTTGVVLDPSGFTVGGGPWKQESPSITFGAENYFVVWHDRRNVSGIGIYGTRVSTSGTVLNPSGIQISYVQDYVELYPTIAFNGENYLVVWYRLGGLLYAALMDTSGQVIDSFMITDNIDHLSHPSISSDGTGYFVVWQDDRNADLDIYGSRVNPSGMVLDTTGIPISAASGDQACPTVAFDGTDYIVLWEDYRNVFTDIYGARVSTAGIVLDTFTVTMQKGNQFSPALVKGPGEKLLVTYSGFVDSINTRPANTMRIWGKLFIPPVGVKEGIPISKPLHFSLRQNFPNPIFSETQITYSIPGNSNAITNLKIYNVTGRQVKTLVNKNQLTGFYTVRWDCNDIKGNQVPNGIYFYRLSVGEKIAVKKMVVIR
ncbi:hypothetical protein ES703_66502 [subsurface metagenome]